MIEIDGAFGEGGGQILRSALTLSLLSKKPFRIKNIRANRSKPGLMRQHLTAVNAATELSQAEVSGDRVASTELVFRPKELITGDFEFAIGTAGSTTLVLQTLLPVLAFAEEKSLLRIKGGTHNPFAPSFDFLNQAFLPVFCKMGFQVKCRLEKVGFYPAGGGSIYAEFDGAREKIPLALNYRGKIKNIAAKVTLSALPEHIAKRELQIIRERLGLERENLRTEVLHEDYGPGNVITVSVESEHVTEVFCGFGEKGKKAEAVAERVCELVSEYLSSNIPVARHMADQLLLPLALIGGEFETLSLTPHFISNSRVIEQFLGTRIETEEIEKGRWKVRV